MAHGYLRGGGLEDVIDEAGLVDDADGRLVIYRLKADDQSWPTGHVAPRALVAVDCARSGTSFGPRSLGNTGIAGLSRFRR